MREHCTFCGDAYEHTCSRCVARVLATVAADPFHDQCDDWFKVEPTPMQEAMRAFAAIFDPLFVDQERRSQADAMKRTSLYVGLFTASAEAAAKVAAVPKPSDPAEPEPAVHEPKPVPPAPLSGAATAYDLGRVITKYGFRDRHGHPLDHCAEFIEMARRAELATNLATAIPDWRL